MRKLIVGLVILSYTVGSCKKDSPAVNRIKQTSFEISLNQARAFLGDTITLTVNEELGSFDSIAFVKYKPLEIIEEGKSYTLSFAKCGLKAIQIRVYTGNEIKTGTANITITPSELAQELSYQVINTYTRGTDHYTQGFEFLNGVLYESLGQYGSSEVLKYDASFQVDSRRSLAANEFGEGLSILNDSVYQLTWKENTCHIYDLDLNPLGTYPLPSAEGWGLCNDGSQMFYSNGSNQLLKLSPSFTFLEMVEVYNFQSPLMNINELEYLNGKVYANIFQSDKLFIIDPKSGKAESFVEFNALRNMLTNPTAGAFNGIAYNPQTQSFLLTGKNWDKMFEVTIN